MTQNRDDNGRSVEGGRIVCCANCGSIRVTTTQVDDEFRYGEGAAAILLQMRAPLRTCKDCGFQFLDEEAEDLRQKAIAEHQAVMGA